MRLIGLAVVLALSLVLALLAAEAQQAAKVYHVGLISAATPVSKMAGRAWVELSLLMLTRKKRSDVNLRCRRMI